MVIEELKTRWKEISGFEDRNDYKVLRITRECIPDLYLGVDGQNDRSLLLYLPPNFANFKFRPAKGENISIAYLKELHVIVIKLEEFNYSDLFNDLIFSLYIKLYNISDPEVYTNTLITTFFKWADFFHENSGSRLTEEKIKGIFGELFYLKKTLENAMPETINQLLEAWEGPYHKGQDFIFDTKNVEVKCKSQDLSTVKISSEFQLTREHGKRVELFVVSVRTDYVNGNSIKEQALGIKDIILANLGDISIFYRALSELNAGMESIVEYDNYRYKVIYTELFDCSDQEFPGLSKSNIPEEVTKLRYNLRISDLKGFLIEKVDCQ